MGFFKFLFKTLVYGVFVGFVAIVAKVLMRKYKTETAETTISGTIEK